MTIANTPIRNKLPEINCPLIAVADAAIDLMSRAEKAVFYYLLARGRLWTTWDKLADTLSPPFSYDELIAATDGLVQKGEVEQAHDFDLPWHSGSANFTHDQNYRVA